jgi:SnoaL-like domain
MQFSDLISRFAAAAASGDGDALADLFTPDGTYDDYFFGPQTGRAAIKKMLAHFAEGGRDFRWEFFDPVAAGNLGYASYRFSFTSTRAEANGARVVFDGIGRFDLEAGLEPGSRVLASAAIRKCSTAAWRWRSRLSRATACATLASSMPRR